MPSISRDEAAHLARLARLELAPDELDHLAGQLDVIAGYVARVSEVAADDIPPTSHALPMTNFFRADEPRPCLSSEAALAAAPDAEDGRFRVPRILGEEA
jgi:aspartyl-tRNA(Asn)/glutamyl-tRNA(Gln) amidotransferase subunit C